MLVDAERSSFVMIVGGVREITVRREVYDRLDELREPWRYGQNNEEREQPLSHEPKRSGQAPIGQSTGPAPYLDGRVMPHSSDGAIGGAAPTDVGTSERVRGRRSLSGP